MPGLSIRVRGIVQGVGFRPFVWRLAKENGITGSVLNDAEGVQIEAWGDESDLSNFQQSLIASPPPLAKIEFINSHPLQGDVPGDFRIIGSVAGETQTGVSPDASTCPDCLSETMNPEDRRFRYPFTNCTHCGPRLSILGSVPYDRPHTSMADFTMCEECQAEYDDPANRRFHAQPNACPKCGPRVWIEDRDGKEVEPDSGSDPLQLAVRLIDDGKILAIKGIGGFHLACDATQAETVARLRERKRRYGKPFALMAPDVERIKEFALLNEEEERLLKDHAAPILILEAAGKKLPSDVAPGQTSLGFMLPYTPLHHVLLDQLMRPVVMTSGNRSDEPQCFDNWDVREKLSGIADCFLMNDRIIVNRLDDSVLRFMDGAPRFLRRARGYTPEPLVLPKGFEEVPQILAMGGEQKNTFCLMKNGRAVVSQHMGDLEEMTVLKDYLASQELYENLFDHRPQCIAVDMHPGYLSSQKGKEWSKDRDLPLVEIQHHHAHVAACMVEHGLPADTDDVLGIVLDGLGLGEEGAIWGGEFLKAGYTGFERLARFKPAPMIGGAQATREPWRSAYAHLRQSLDWNVLNAEYASLDIMEYLKDRPLRNLDTMVERGVNSPLASSCGRLFDAVAAVLGICREAVTFEGEAAILLENLAARFFENEKSNAYPSSVLNEKSALRELVWDNTWSSILDDLKNGEDRAVVAARFHQGIVKAVSELAGMLAKEKSLRTVVLSGGVFQNRLILEGVSEALTSEGLRVLSPQLYPANDGGISLGQAVIAAATMQN